MWFQCDHCMKPFSPVYNICGSVLKTTINQYYGASETGTNRRRNRMLKHLVFHITSFMIKALVIVFSNKSSNRSNHKYIQDITIICLPCSWCFLQKRRWWSLSNETGRRITGITYSTGQRFFLCVTSVFNGNSNGSIFKIKQ